MKALFDTNILIDYLKGEPKAKLEFELYDAIHISIITWIEVLVGAQDEEDEIKIKQFLSQFQIHQLTQDIAAKAIIIRKKDKLRLPDALIRASAKHLGFLFVTRNTKDFSEKEPGVRVPY